MPVSETGIFVLRAWRGSAEGHPRCTLWAAKPPGQQVTYMSGTASEALPAPQYDVAIILVAYKAVEIIERCLPTVTAHLNGVCAQIILWTTSRVTERSTTSAGRIRRCRSLRWAAMRGSPGPTTRPWRSRGLATCYSSTRTSSSTTMCSARWCSIWTPTRRGGGNAGDGGRRRAAAGARTLAAEVVDAAGGSLREICGGRAHVLRGWANRRHGGGKQIAGDEGERGPVEAEWVPGRA